MRLTEKLLSFLNRVFDKDPGRFLALRLSYNGGMTWRVRDAVLTTTVTGGSGADLRVDLSEHTLRTLVSYLAAQPGYTTLYADQTELLSLSARILIDGDGNIERSNGDHLYGYTSTLWAYLEATANELQRAEAQIEQMLLQMSTRTASDEWLDELGGYYGVPRLAGEADRSYAPRIIAEVLRPRANNVAMEMAIREFTGQSVSVADVVVWGDVFPLYNGLIEYDGSEQHDPDVQPVYGLFDVECGYDLLNGGSIAEFAVIVRGLINRLRAAGTQLRALSLKGSVLTDTFPAAPSDTATLVAAPAIADTMDPPTEAMSGAISMPSAIADDASPGLDAVGLLLLSDYRYSGLRTYGGAITYRGNTTSVEDVGSPGDVPFSLVFMADGAVMADGSEVADGLRA